MTVPDTGMSALDKAIEAYKKYPSNKKFKRVEKQLRHEIKREYEKAVYMALLEHSYWKAFIQTNQE